jgi:3-methyladenine DNA glycosylase AlkD
MSAQAVLDELARLGSEKTRATYRRHGVGGEQFGVSYADLGKLKKRIRVDHAVAAGLWGSGNHDARILATMVGDPAAATEAELDAWAAGVENHVQADALAGFAAAGPHALRCVERWMASGDEWTAAAAWGVLARVAADPGRSDDWFRPFVETIERDIYGAKNRVRHAMNNALIAIGARSDPLEALAIAAARRIGPVRVDHGDTDCKTPGAEAYILKTRARRKK